MVAEQGLPTHAPRRRAGHRDHPVCGLCVPGIGSCLVSARTSLLIMVGVGLDTVKQLQSQLQQGNYEGFLR